MTMSLDMMFAQFLEILSSARMEIILFTCAFLVHHLMFASGVWKETKRTKNKFAASKGDETPTSQREEDDAQEAIRSFEASYERGDHRGVLRHWNILRKSDSISPVHLARTIEAMQRFKKEGSTIIAEVRGYIKRNSRTCNTAFVNTMLKIVAKSLDVHVITGIADAMAALNIAADSSTYEVLIGTFFSIRAFADVERLAQELVSKGLAPTWRTSLTLLKTALQKADLDGALAYLRVMSNSSGSPSTGSPPPTHIIAQLVELACREHRAALVVDELERGCIPITTEVLNAVLAETAKSKNNGALAQRIEKLASEQGITKNGRTYQLLTGAILRGGHDRARLEQMLGEMQTNQELSSCTQEIAQSVLNYCTQHADVELADKLQVKIVSMSTTAPLPILSALLRFYADMEMPEKACELYEQIKCASKVRCVLDSTTERSIIGAALKLGREETVVELLKNTSNDTAKLISIVRNCAASGNLNGAMIILKALQSSGHTLSNSLWNTVLDSCVECRSLERAEEIMKRMIEEKVVDAVSYNTMIKAQLHQDNYDRACSIMDEMRTAGFPPNNVTYNELITSLARSDKEHRRAMVWDVVAEMQKAGVRPNRITCSILLRNLKAKSSFSDLVRTMELAESMEEPMDEVLLSSIVEASVRTGKTGFLAQQLQKLHGTGQIKITGAHTFGSLIKAYGFIKDIDGAWRCWKQMRCQHVKPTSITIGCMVEAVVSNGDVDGGYEIICDLLEDESCKGQVNAIIYGSVLKGYGRARKLDRVLAVFDEMTARGIEPALTTFNAVLDACARSGQMQWAPKLLDDMDKCRLEPNLITYSTVMKGFCQAGDMSAALKTFEKLKKSRKFQADEIVYNTMLDGCVTQRLPLEGEKLFEDMQRSGVAPSSYTITCMVKLLSEAGQIDRAQEIQEAFPSYQEVANAKRPPRPSRDQASAVGHRARKLASAAADCRKH